MEINELLLPVSTAVGVLGKYGYDLIKVWIAARAGKDDEKDTDPNINTDAYQSLLAAGQAYRDELRADMRELKIDIQSRDKKIESLDDALSQWERMHHRCEDQLETAKTEIGLLANRVAQLEGVSDKYRQDRNLFANEYNKCKQEIRQLKSQVESYTGDLPGDDDG